MIGSVCASFFSPNRRIEMWGLYGISNASQINSSSYCDGSGNCGTTIAFQNTEVFFTFVNGSMNSSSIKNTPAACSVTNSFMTEYTGASSTCTAIDFDDVEIARLNVTDVLNMTNRNVTDIQCLLFESGGKICSGT